MRTPRRSFLRQRKTLQASRPAEHRIVHAAIARGIIGMACDLHLEACLARAGVEQTGDKISEIVVAAQQLIRGDARPILFEGLRGEARAPP